MILSKYLLFALLFFCVGCPMTCFVNPSLVDTLTRQDSQRVNGLLLDFTTGDSSPPPLPNTAMPCDFVYYRENYADYESLGTTSEPCDTSSSTGGVFDETVEMPSPGLYRLLFETPTIYQTETRLITSRPDLTAAEDTYLYINWDYQDPRWDDDNQAVRESYIRLFSETLNWEGYNFLERTFMTLALGELGMIEIERVAEEYFDGLRIILWRPEMGGEPGPMLREVAISSCGGEVDAEGCRVYPWGVAAVDYLDDNCLDNLDPAILDALSPEYLEENYNEDTGCLFQGASPAFVYVPSMVEWALFTIPGVERGGIAGWLTTPPDDSFETRVEDVGRYIGKVVVHEAGHQLGLVAGRPLFSNRGTGFYPSEHTPDEPPFLGAVRYIPREILSYQWTGSTPSLFDDCDTVPRNRTDLGASEEMVVERCPAPWNSFNHQYLREILGL